MGELINQVKTSQVMPARERRGNKEAKAVYDEVRLRGLQSDGVMAALPRGGCDRGPRVGAGIDVEVSQGWKFLRSPSGRPRRA